MIAATRLQKTDSRFWDTHAHDFRRRLPHASPSPCMAPWVPSDPEIRAMLCTLDGTSDLKTNGSNADDRRQVKEKNDAHSCDVCYQHARALGSGRYCHRSVLLRFGFGNRSVPTGTVEYGGR